MSNIEPNPRAKLFQQVFSAYGQPVDDDLAKDIGLAAMISDVRSLYPNAYCGYIDNRYPNAIATSYKAQEFIAFFSGLTYSISAFFYTILSDPSLFPNIGDCSKETRNLKRIATLGSTLSQVTLIKECFNLPCCDIRRHFAQFMISCAHLFIFYHEVGHLEGCHLPLLSHLFGRESYHEFPIQEISRDENMLRKALELDADMTGLLTGVNVWRNLWSVDSQGHPVSLDPDFVWSTSIQTLFIFMEWIGARMSAQGSSSHPSPLIRMVHAREAMEKADFFGIEGIPWDKSSAAIQNVLPWMKEHYYSSLPRTLFEANDAARDGEELGTLLECWEYYLPLLREYRTERGSRPT